MGLGVRRWAVVERVDAVDEAVQGAAEFFCGVVDAQFGLQAAQSGVADQGWQVGQLRWSPSGGGWAGWGKVSSSRWPRRKLENSR